MKIERLSENQIRCTLNKADLADKQLKISELAYGSPKAKELFMEMMQQASNELGFEVDDIPLMIEAIPISSECLILIVTKVEDPEELDTRFSRFTGTENYESDYDNDNDDYNDEASDDEDNFFIHEDGNPIISGHIDIGINGDKTQIPESIYDALEGFVNSLSNLANNLPNTDANPSDTDDSSSIKKEQLARVIIFDNLNTAIKASKQVSTFYFSTNTLYKNPGDNRFYLLFTNDNNTVPEFNRACSILSEYGSLKKITPAMPYHYREHFKTIISDEAVQTMSAL